MKQHEKEILEDQLKRHNQRFWVCLFIVFLNVGIFVLLLDPAYVGVGLIGMLGMWVSIEGSKITLKSLGREEEREDYGIYKNRVIAI